MRAINATLAIFSFATGLVAFGADSHNGMAAYREADYKTAIPLLQAAARNNPKDPLVRAALLSALVYEGRVDEASDASDADAVDFPDSPEVIAARGEFAYYMGNVVQAEKLFKNAAKLKETPRAAFGLYRLFYAASLYRAARLLCLRAHEIDPDDALITRAWLGYLVPEKRRELLGPFIAAHPWLFKKYERDRNTDANVSEEMGARKAFDFEGERKPTTLHLVELRDSPTRVRGLGLELSIEGGRRLKLLFDTGASGILISQAAIDKAGLNHLGSFEARGIGDKGPRNAFVAVADNCRIGALAYKTCVLRALQGKGRVAGDKDGLIGADFFSDYIIEIDFQKRLLNLTPQPPRVPNPQGYDRVIAANEAGFTPVFRFGHQLCISTTLNGKSSGLFLLDTGSDMSSVDSTFARLSTKIRGNSDLHVKGISGEVKDVFEADKADIQFAGYHQQNFGLTAINLNNSNDHEEVRMAGILGLPVLALFRLTLDYRNGLVKFDYVYK